MPWKHRRDWNYEPTQQEIAAGCAEIQRGWTEQDRIQRRVRRPIERHWYPPWILDIRNEQGEFYFVMGELYDF